MNGALLAAIGRVFATLSLVSIGGANAVLPEIHRQVVDVRHWMSDTAFTDAFAIANAAPGPNVILVSLIGWQLAGLAGLLVATVAIMTPSCLLAYAVARLLRRHPDHRVAARLKAGLVPVALGLLLAGGATMMRAADHGAVDVALSVATAAYVVLTTRNPLWALAAVTVVRALLG